MRCTVEVELPSGDVACLSWVTPSAVTQEQWNYLWPPMVAQATGVLVRNVRAER